MVSRLQRNDTPADQDLRRCLSLSPPKCFTMIAGAGSGKTTSLIKGLGAVIDVHGNALRLKRQRVACITYTEVAAEEIWADVGNNALALVKTIHSFLWTIIKPFQSDIGEWVRLRIEEKIADLQEKAAGFGPRVRATTREKNRKETEWYRQLRADVLGVRTFRYETASNYRDGVLGHDDIIKMVTRLVIERPLLRVLIAQQFPFIFVDESQDTMGDVTVALKAIAADPACRLCLGFFGDPMQRIYMTGVGNIPPEDGWVEIRKPENFRCPKPVLDVANAIRKPADGLVQAPGKPVKSSVSDAGGGGSARIFILPADDMRTEKLAKVRVWMSREHEDALWLEEDTAAAAQEDERRRRPKILILVHRMAAKRLGFADLFAALNDKAPEAFKAGISDASAWPVRPFMSFVLPIVQASRSASEFAVMQMLRASPLLRRASLQGANVGARLSEMQRHVEALVGMLTEGSNATAGDVLAVLRTSGLIELDHRIVSYLEVGAALPAGESGGDVDEGEADKERASMEAFLRCRATQFWGYKNYVDELSPFSTQHGVKGAEFERVLVVLDDGEGTHTHYSYEKYLELKDLSDTDRENIAEGKDSVIDRTRRLFYVCCTRALRDLVVVLFTADPAVAEAKIRTLGLFPQRSILSSAALDGL